MKRGMGEDQTALANISTRKILDVLDDGKWHRYTEILKETKVSPTTLSKRLRELEKGIVERKLNVEAKEYPPPVEYRLKNNGLEVMRQGDIRILEKLMDNIGKNKEYDPVAIADFFEDFYFFMKLYILENLDWYFFDKNETAYRQYFEYYIVPNFVETITMLKEKLLKIEENKVNINDLLGKARERINGEKVKNQRERVTIAKEKNQNTP